MSKLLLKGRSYYKPFSYPEFYDRWKIHERSHWLPTEITMHEDINDWKTKLKNNEKQFLVNIFRFFTQGDVDVAGAYCTEYLPNFSQTPEIAMFLCSVAAREAIHIDAYSYLIETLGMPDSTYKEFLEYKEMSDKQEYLKKFKKNNYKELNNITTPIITFIITFLVSLAFLLVIQNIYFPNNIILLVQLILFFLLICIWVNILLFNLNQSKLKKNIASGIALFSGFTEGMQLFSSFTMLLSFPMNGLMKGMGQIVTWSIVDETQHTDGMISLFKIFVNENSNCTCIKILGCSCINKNSLEKNVYKIANEMVNLEDNFINLAYKEYAEKDEFMNISKTKLKKYIRFIANKRLDAMGYKKIFEQKTNPLPEFEVMINAPINTNFFENRPTDYAKTDNGSWGNIWGSKIKLF